MTSLRAWIGCSGLLVIGCGDTASTSGNESISTGESLTGVDPTNAASSAPGSESGGSGSASLDGSGSSSAAGDDEGPKFDVGTSPDTIEDTEGPQPTCHVVDDMDAVGDCSNEAPADSFEPAVQWTFGPTEQSWVTP